MNTESFKQATNAFKLFNKREPTPAEATHLKAFLGDEARATNLLVTPIKQKKNSLRFEIFLCDFNNKASMKRLKALTPNRKSNMTRFIEFQESGLKQIVAEPMVTDVVQKASSTKYTLDVQVDADLCVKGVAMKIPSKVNRKRKRNDEEDQSIRRSTRLAKKQKIN
eukprot:78499_1